MFVHAPETRLAAFHFSFSKYLLPRLCFMHPTRSPGARYAKKKEFMRKIETLSLSFSFERQCNINDPLFNFSYKTAQLEMMV